MCNLVGGLMDGRDWATSVVGPTYFSPCVGRGAEEGFNVSPDRPGAAGRDSAEIDKLDQVPMTCNIHVSDRCDCASEI